MVPFSIEYHYIHGRNILSMDLDTPWGQCSTYLKYVWSSCFVRLVSHSSNVPEVRLDLQCKYVKTSRRTSSTFESTEVLVQGKYAKTFKRT